jgi:beta-lactamase class A
MSRDFSSLNALSEDQRIDWSVLILDIKIEQPLFEYKSNTVLKTASVPKIVLLHEISKRIESGILTKDQAIDRRTTVQVTDSGIWQHLSTNVLPLVDIVVFVATASDNLATNTLIDLVGLNELESVSKALGLSETRLNDYVRSIRNPDIHPSTVSQGTAYELATFCAIQECLNREGNAISQRLTKWMELSVDFSMIPNDFGLDPLAHHEGFQSGFKIWNKTGTDNGVRADVGIVEYVSGVTIAFAVIANWTDITVTDSEVLSKMRHIGRIIKEYCQQYPI